MKQPIYIVGLAIALPMTLNSVESQNSTIKILCDALETYRYLNYLALTKEEI